MLDSSLPVVRDVSSQPGPRRWLRMGLWIGAGLLVLLCIALASLDFWLRRTLEKQVATASQGRYRMVIDDLRTQLWSRTVLLRGVHLRSAAVASENLRAKLPDLSVDLTELRVAGIGIGAALRRQVVPVESVVLNGLQLQLGPLPSGRPDNQTQPLYRRLPLELPGLRVGYLALRRVRARYGTTQHTQAQFEQGNLIAHDLNLSAASATDTTRLGYAASLSADVRNLLARLPGHVLRVRHGAFSSASQYLALDSVRVVPLQAISNQRSQTTRADLALPRLRLLGLRAAGLQRGRFQADELHLVGLRLLATVPAVTPTPLHKQLAPYLPSFRLARLQLTQGQVQVLGLEQAPAVRNISLIGQDVRIRPDTRHQLYYARAWTLRTGPARLSLDTPHYRLTFQTLQVDTRRRQLALRNVALGPTMSVAALARSKGYQAAHVRVRVPQVRATGVDWEALIEKGKLLAQQVEVRRARMITESDGRFAINPSQSVATPDALGRLPFRVDVRQLRLVDLAIQMSYRSPRSAQPGVMSMQQLTGTVSNISNDPRRMSAARPLTGHVTGWVQKICAARFSLRANVLDPHGAHTVSGAFGATPLAILNPMILPTRGLRLRSGQIDQIRFRMQLDHRQAQGTMWATYHDLKLDLLNRQNRPGLLHRVKTSAANGLFLRDNNPRKPGEAVETGSMTSNRELRYSVFSLWRQGLVSGMLNSAGVPAALAKKLSESE